MPITLTPSQRQALGLVKPEAPKPIPVATPKTDGGMAEIVSRLQHSDLKLAALIESVTERLCEEDEPEEKEEPKERTIRVNFHRDESGKITTADIVIKEA